MAQTKDSEIFSIIHPVCCGLDVHKKSMSACLTYTDKNGEVIHDIRTFRTSTPSIELFKEWLIENDCPIVAMESTGIYWRPVHNILEGYIEVVLVNARLVKNIPGKKTDIQDCKWLSGLLRHGLVRGSYIPPQQMRDWREWVRMRKSLVETAGDFKRRIQKVFECANIKIDSVISDLFGVSGRNLIELFIYKNSELTKADIERCVRGQLRKKVNELLESVKGFFRPHHQKMLKSLMEMLQIIEQKIEEINALIKGLMSAHDELRGRLNEVPGVSDVSSSALLAELGPTLDSFETTNQLSSWCGLCPGNNESAGKRRSCRSPVRNHPLKTLMIEVAWAAIKKKNSYYKEKYYRMKARRGAKRAIVAIAHRILKSIFHIIKYGKRYLELGKEHFYQVNRNNIYRLKKQAKMLGFDLVLKETGEVLQSR